MTRVSVCITTFNHERYIKDCLISVIGQLIDVDLEILVGDDNSSDRTQAIVEGLAQKFPEVIRYFKHEPNLGPSANYQYLVARAQGDFIAHLDGDDHWLPGKLIAQLNFMAAHPDCVACYTNAVAVSDLRRLVGGFTSKVPETFDRAFLLRKGNFLNHSSLLYRASAKQEITQIAGPFIDYRIHLNLGKRGLLGFVDEALVVYRCGSAHSMVRTAPDNVMLLYLEALMEVQDERSLAFPLRAACLDFWCRIVTDAITRGRVAWAIKWARLLKQDYRQRPVGLLLAGVGLAILRLPYLVLRRAIPKLGLASDLRVLHER